MRVFQANKGSAIVVQNSINKGFFYIVKSGQLAIDSEHSMADKELSRFEPGDSFGIVSALTGHRFMVTVFAAKNSEIIEIPIQDLGKFLKSRKDLAVKMLGLYTKELRAIHKYFATYNDANDHAPAPHKLLNNAKILIQLKQPKFASYALNKFIQWQKDTGSHQFLVDEANELLKSIGIDYAGPVWQSNSATLNENEILFMENEKSSEIYVVKSGAVRLFTLVRGQELVLDVLGPGEIFGEMAFIDESNRMASAVTDRQTELIRLTKQTLFDEVGESILNKIFKSLARRIWFSHQRLIILRISDPVTRLYAFVYNLIRNADILSSNQDKSYTFAASLSSLKRMCGLSRVNDHTIEPFLKDKNIVITNKSIEILDRKRIEEKVVFLKTQTGQISANVV